MVQCVALYGAAVWDVSQMNKRKMMVTEMDFLRRSCRRSRLERVRNETIRAEMDIGRSIADEIERRRLILEWVPPEGRKRIGPRRSWRDDVEQAMSAGVLEEDACHDRKIWKWGTAKRRQL